MDPKTSLLPHPDSPRYQCHGDGSFLLFRGQNTNIVPASIPRDPERVNDVAPKEWWGHDILTQEGEEKFLAVVDEIKQACEALVTVP
jgi:hypothetical protein